jgi:hypothetical protein
MLTGSVVGDGEYCALIELFEAHGGALVFDGHYDTRGAAEPEPVSYVLQRPTEGEQLPADIVEARAELELSASEVVACCETLGSALGTFAHQVKPRHAQPIVAAIDVDDSDRLRLLMLSPAAPGLGRLIFRLDPRSTPPSLVGGSPGSATRGAEPDSIRAALRRGGGASSGTSASSRPVELDEPESAARALHPPAEALQPDEAGEPSVQFGSAEALELMAYSAGRASRFPCARGKAEAQPDDQPQLAPASPPPREEDATGGIFQGTQDAAMFGSVAISLALIERVESEPAAAAKRCEIGWPPAVGGVEAEGRVEAEDAAGAAGAAQAATELPIRWWRCQWRTPEMGVDDAVFAAFCGADVLVVHPTRAPRHWDVGKYTEAEADERAGGRVRDLIRGQGIRLERVHIG